MPMHGYLKKKVRVTRSHNNPLLTFTSFNNVNTEIKDLGVTQK